MSIFFSLFGKDYLVLVDSHSKWLEIELMRGATSYHTIETLRKWISQFGLPTQLVSDNGPQFVSNDFKLYLEKNGIKHIRSSVYHPCSNGGAERFIQTIKKGLKACHIETGDTWSKLSHFLLGYRTTPSSVTGKTPSELFLGRQICTRLDTFKPNPPVPLYNLLLKKRMDKYNDTVRNRTMGRSAVRRMVKPS